MTNKLKGLILAFLMANTGAVQASIILSGDVAAGTGVLSITSDLNFTITANSVARLMVFDEWGSPQDSSVTNASPTGPVSVKVNGTVISPPQAQLFWDNYASNTIAPYITANDAIFVWTSSIPVSVGDVVTIGAGSWALAAVPSWNPATSGTFTGDVYLGNGIPGGRVSSSGIAAVPEPGTLLLLGIGLAGLGFARRHRLNA